MIHGANDEVVPSDVAAKLARKLSSQKSVTVEYKEIPKADHLFSGHMEELTAAVEAYLDKALAPAG
jgi:alpha/beta superfamily hydrolase